MILNNNLIKEDLKKEDRKQKSILIILFYCLIIILFISFLSFSVINSIEILDLLASIFCKISIISFSLIVLEGAVVSIIDYLKKDFYIYENLWKVIEGNLTDKITENKKTFLKFSSGYILKVEKSVFENAKIGERYFLVIRDYPCKEYIKFKKKIYYAYKKSDFEKYENDNFLLNDSSQKVKLTDKIIKKSLFLYNLPDFLEMMLISLSISMGMGTIGQMLKQQYLTYLGDDISVIFAIIVFCLSIVFLNSLKRKKIKHIAFKQCVLVEDNQSFSLIAKYKEKYSLVKIFPKNSYIDYSNKINKKRDF